MDNEIMYIKLDDIIPNRFQPREVFDDESLNKLADSIRQHGVIEPIIVRPISNKYEIIAGERRYKASVLAGLTKIPAMVRQLDDKESSIIAFIENEHRSDVSAIEEARTMERILKNNNMTQEELGKELGINQSTIANKLRLLNLPLEVQESLMRNEISERHARSLLSVKNEEQQLELLKKIKEKRMTVRELDSEIKDMNNVNENMNDNNMNPVFNSYLNNDDNLVSKEEPMAPNFDSYLNNNDNSTEPLPSFSNPQEGFVSFLNDYNPISQESMNVEQEEPTIENFELPKEESMASEPGFMDFLNNYDNNYPIEEEKTEQNPVVTNEELPKEEPGFMDFLNNYDNNHPLSNEATEVTTQPQEDLSTNESVDTSTYFNNYNINSSNEIPVVEQEESNPVTEDMGFMNFLNSYDNNSPLQEEPISQPPQESSPVMEQNNFLNDYENKTMSEETPVVVPEEPKTTSEDMGFMNFLNSYDNNFGNEAVKEENNGFNESTYNNYAEPTSNVMINDVNPPITTDFNNQYVEDNPNYVDVSKQAVIDNIDEIIARLKTVVDDIKNSSKYKIDTDEINYDDIYQITIKIDKRDF